MNKSKKIIIVGLAFVGVVAGVLTAKHFIRADKDSVRIIGGADGPTSVFLAGEVPSDMK